MNMHKNVVDTSGGRKRKFTHRCLSSHYSKRAPKLNVRAWVGKEDYLIRDMDGNTVNINEGDISDLIAALIDLKSKKAIREKAN